MKIYYLFSFNVAWSGIELSYTFTHQISLKKIDQFLHKRGITHCFLVEMNHRVLVNELPHAPCDMKTSEGIFNANSNASSILPISARRAPSKMDQPFFSQNPSCASFEDLQLSA